MKLEHTPGPWEYSGHCELDCSYHVGVAGDKNCSGMRIDDEHSIALLIADVWDEPKEAQSNARLIASAPEMLEALIEIVDRYPCSPWITDVPKKLIEKATGKTWEEIGGSECTS